MADLDKRGIDGLIELQFDGKMEIEENIISDWYGHGISASVIQKPYKVTLNSAYPNPFNPVTSISYELSEMEHVTLSVYNLMGQLMETLIDRYQDAGNHTLTWDASQQPSGMYFLRMETKNEMFYQKLMLIK